MNKKLDNSSIRKKNIPREYINKTLVDEYYSIWDIVQLLGHGAVQVDKLPKEIQDRVYAELHRRGKLWRNTMSRSKHSSIVNQPLDD